jgi:hypothetical protein
MAKNILHEKKINKLQKSILNGKNLFYIAKNILYCKK